ncbi:GAF domain-containing protein [Eisenibacter elegans]|uniref:GAF domain-containing protein n=1 Tax=Eisenibacter elegans TaxID=997 RepID=UPI00047CE497|nr:GAF domain-containing protein [Eisenibacter elegans]
MAKKRFGIRKKLFLAFSTLIALSGTIGLLAVVFLNHIATHQRLQNSADELLVKTLELRQAEQAYLLNDSKSQKYLQTGQSTQLAAFEDLYQEAVYRTQELERSEISARLGLQGQIQHIQQSLKKYNELFIRLSDKLFQRGFKDEGIEGQLRALAHELEALDTLPQRYILAIRRHEKDFLMRKNPEDIRRLYAQVELMTNAYAGDPVIRRTIEEYRKKLVQLYQIEEEIGLDSQSGLSGQMATLVGQLEDDLSQLHYRIIQETNFIIWRSLFVLLGVGLLMLLAAVGFVLYFTHAFSRPLIILDKVAQSVTQGLKNQDQVLESIRANDEIGSLATSLRQMLITLKEKIRQANERSEKLEEFAKGEAQRNWHNEGLAIFNEIFRKNHLDLHGQAFEIIAQLVKYTQSVQGGILIVKNPQNTDEEPVLELTACYAYERRKYLQKHIRMGEGLIGSVWREGDTALITDIPQDYAQITSGLGKARPNSLLIVPLRHEDKVEGVIELISFREFGQHEIHFVETLSDKIASVFTSIQAQERTRRLLAATEAMAHKAQEREEKLKKQIENYEHWVRQFEPKLQAASEEALLYQAIINKVFDGLIITDEKFSITKVNHYILKRFGYSREELVGQSVDVLIETDYNNIIDLREKRFKLSYRSFRRSVAGKVIDRNGLSLDVEMMSGKMEIENKLMYVFVFNEFTLEEMDDAETMPEPEVIRKYHSIFE